jgi:hypothetical protein
MPELSLLVSIGRVLLVGYATVATVLASACLAMQAITHFDRQARRRRRHGLAAHSPLFVRLDPQADAPLGSVGDPGPGFPPPTSV